MLNLKKGKLEKYATSVNWASMAFFVNFFFNKTLKPIIFKFFNAKLKLFLLF